MVAAAMLLALAACDDKKTPETTTGGSSAALKVETVIFEPKVGVPGDTLLFTAVITSSSQNEGDFPVMEWSASGGAFVETNRQTVQWVAPNSSGVFTITAKATNDVGSSSNKATIFIGVGQNLLTENAGQINLIGTGNDFHYLLTTDVTRGVDVYKYVGGVSSDAVSGVLRNNLNVTYSPDGGLEAHAADSTAAGATVRPRNIYIGDLNSGTLKRLTTDGSKLGNPERNVYNYPSFSPNGQVIAYQRWAQSWDVPVAPDSFHVYIEDLVLLKRTLVTADYAFPRGFFPTFSTDSNWLIYVLDKNRSGQWELFGSPMTGNTVDGSSASVVKMTNTGGVIVSGAPKELKRPPMAWNPVSSVLAIAAADNALHLVQPSATAPVDIAVPEVVKATEIAWSPNGSMLAATFFVTDADDKTWSRIVTVTTAGVATERVNTLIGDIARDLTFSPDGKWLLYRVTRGGGSWFNAADVGAGVLSEPVPVTATDPVGDVDKYRAAMSLRPSWTSTNLMIYPSFGTSSNGTPGIWTRDLSGLVN
jgi:WD40 repeat protein